MVVDMFSSITVRKYCRCQWCYWCHLLHKFQFIIVIDDIYSMPVMSLMLREVIDAKDAIYDSDFNATNDGADETYFIDPRDFILASDAIEAFIW